MASSVAPIAIGAITSGFGFYGGRIIKVCTKAGWNSYHINFFWVTTPTKAQSFSINEKAFLLGTSGPEYSGFMASSVAPIAIGASTSGFGAGSSGDRGHN